MATVTVGEGDAARVAVGVQSLDDYQYVEMTTSGWRIGEVSAGQEITYATGMDGSLTAGEPTIVRVEAAGGVASMYPGD